MNIKTNKEYKVTMHNDLIRSKSTLSLNEIKLLRIVMMQIMMNDTDFKTYQIRIEELAKMIGIDSSNIYKEIDDITTHLMQEIVYIGDGNPKHKWKKFQWVSCCEYNNGIITIQLHEKLKPYLLELKGLYTQYILSDVLILKSTYSIRLYELIREAMRNQMPYSDKRTEIELSIDTIRKATNTEKKYPLVGNFNQKVIVPAVKEMNDKLVNMHVEYEPIKRSRKIIGYKFKIMSQVGYNHFNKDK